MTALTIPEVDTDTDMLSAALDYARAGIYVVPAIRRSKNPGSVIGKNWQAKSSHDPKQITAWFAGTDHDIAVHCGRSGLVVVDVDKPELVPDDWWQHLDAAPYQSTRPDTPGRGHYIFQMPPGRTIGSPAYPWGEIRGLNGVIIAAPSHHKDGGHYQLVRTGHAPTLPAEIAEQLSDTAPAEDAATDAAVSEFIAQYTDSTRPEILHGWKRALAGKIEAGHSRHRSAVPVLTGALKEARAGYFPARSALDALQPIFLNAVALPPKPRTGAIAQSEWAGIVAWAVGQANAATLDEVRARTDEKMPDNIEWVNRIGEAGVVAPQDDPRDDDASANIEAVEGMPRLWRATDLRPAEQPRWLAKRRLPRAAVSLLIGDEGIGKSLFWVWIAAAITSGKPLPEFGIPARSAANVIVVCTEDDWTTTVRPRLDVAAADLAMVSVICTEEDGSGAPVFPRDLFLILEADPKPALVVVDAWLDTVPAALSVRDPQQARQALHPWKEVATTTDAAVLLLTHTNRVASPNARDRYGASYALRQKARLSLYAQQDDEGYLLIGPEKANGTADVPASRFTITSEPFFPPTDDHDGTVPLLAFLGESDRTAREHVAASSEAGSDEPGGNPAKVFIYEYLVGRGGEAPAVDVLKEGRKAGFGEQELKDARRRHRDPRIVSRKASMGDGWVWAVDYGTPEGGNPPEGGSQGGMPPTVPPSPPSGTLVPPSETVPPSSPPPRPPPPGTHSRSPGGPTEKTPGMTPAVERALNAARANGRFAPDPTCFYCDKPVTGKQTDEQGRYAHLSCQRQAEEVHLILADREAIGDDNVTYDPTCSAVRHEHTGPLPPGVQYRVWQVMGSCGSADRDVRRCGRPTKTTGRPCRIEVSNPGQPCGLHRSAARA
jgi:hypothetical protein